MVVDRSRWFYLYLTESYSYSNYYEYLFINGKHYRIGLQSINGLQYYSYC